MLFVFNSGYFKNSWRLKTATSIGIKTNEHLRNNHAVVENFNVQFNAKRERISLHFVYSVHFSHFHKYFQNSLRACQKMYLNLDNVSKLSNFVGRDIDFWGLSVRDEMTSYEQLKIK